MRKTRPMVRAVVVKNLLSVEGLHWFLPNVIKNFSGFAPLGAILALVLGA
ncbi:AbgT family transporter [Escherichia coli]